jgi:cellulose synthase/poly-beta-1,6-N-acetylglucosamine synthase-like glycosyltransferase
MLLMIFWLSVLGIAYAYFGYPLTLYVISKFRSRDVRKDMNYSPSVSLIITVHNEMKRIKAKVKNSMALDYPKDRLEVIFASDFSTDGTDEFVNGYADRGFRLVRPDKRGGKEYAQKCAIAEAKGDIIVFTDVATMLEPDGLKKIVANFADKSVGSVSSEDRFIDKDGKVSGEGAYVKYEMWLRSLETRVNSVVGLSGSFFAARKDVCQDWPVNIPSDFNTLLNSIKKGYRGISDPESLGIYTNIKDESKEFQRKVRTITRGISAFIVSIGLLNPVKYGFFSWQLFSHKLMRWLVPWFMISALAANLVLALRRKIYALMLIGHVLFYIIAAAGPTLANYSSVFKIPYFFVSANRAIAVAWIKYIKGERFVTWTPSER